MEFNTTLFLDTLPYLVKGMAGIFVVTILLVISIALLNRFAGKKE